MPGNEFTALEKATTGIKQKLSRVQSWAKESRWETHNEYGENPFTGLKTIVDINAKYREIYSSFGDDVTEDERDTNKRKLKTASNEQVKALNMNYHLQRYVVANNFMSLLKPMRSELIVAQQDGDTMLTKDLSRDLKDTLKTFKIDQFFSLNEDKDAAYFIDLIDYLNEKYNGIKRKSGAQYKKIMKELQAAPEEEKETVKKTLSSFFKNKSEVAKKGPTVENVKEFVKGGAENVKPLPDQGQAEMTKSISEVENNPNGDIVTPAGSEPKVEDSKPRSKKIKVRVKK